MKKQLNTTAIINELKGASVFFPSRKDAKNENREPQLEETQPSEPATSQSISRPVSQPTDESTSQSTRRLVNP